jgi:hypothetical protein
MFKKYQEICQNRASTCRKVVHRVHLYTTYYGIEEQSLTNCLPFCAIIELKIATFIFLEVKIMGNRTWIRGPLKEILEYLMPRFDKGADEREADRAERDRRYYAELSNFTGDSSAQDDERRTCYLNQKDECVAQINRSKNYRQDISKAAFSNILAPFSSLKALSQDDLRRNCAVLSFSYIDDNQRVSSFFIEVRREGIQYLFNLAIFEDFAKQSQAGMNYVTVLSDEEYLPKNRPEKISDQYALKIAEVQEFSERQKNIIAALNSQLFAPHIQYLLKGGLFAFEYITALKTYFSEGEEARLVKASQLEKYVNDLFHYRWYEAKMKQNFVCGFILRHPYLTSVAVGFIVCLLFTAIVASCGFGVLMGVGGLSFGAAAGIMGTGSTMATIGAGGIFGGAFFGGLTYQSIPSKPSQPTLPPAEPAKSSSMSEVESKQADPDSVTALEV